MAEPTRFGFLDEDPAPIMVTGSSLSLRSNSLSLVGGGLFLNGTSIESRSGHMSLASVASPGEAVIEGADIQLDDFDRLGPISLVGSDLRASEGFVPGVGAGSIRIVGGQFVMDGARIRSFAFDEDAGDIHIETSEGIELVNGSEVVSNAQSAGQGANILIDTQGDLRVGPNTRILTHSEDAGAAGAIVANVENLIITDGNISSWAWGAGDAGDIRITARDTVSISGPASDFAVGIASIAASDAGNAGNAGSLVITADTLTMNGGTINTETLLSAGAAGDITIEVGTLEMTKEAIISTASRRGQGAAGTLSVDASEGVSLRGRSILQSTTSSDGAGGSILVSTPDLVLRDRSAIQSFTLGSADAGDIVLDVGNLTLVNSQINSDAQPGSRGNGGNITLTASGTIQLLNPDNDFLFKPRISSTTLGSGDSGQITISAREVILDNGAIDTNTLRSGSGNAGRIVVDVGRLTVKNGGSIDSGSGLGSSGLGGEIIVNATEAVTISGAALAFGLELQSGITTITTGSGDAGSITITAPILEIDLGDVAATTAGSGKGGTITLNVDRLSLTGGGNIQARSVGSGAAGNIRIDADTISIVGTDPRDGSGSGLYSRTEDITGGEGGDVVVTTNHLELADGARISAESRAEDGNAGNISLTARDSLTMTDSFVETRSELSAGGNIHIQVEDTLLAQNSVINASANGVSPGDDGGNVTIQPSRFIILNNSDITAQANAGNGGNITIRVEFILQSAESTIDASSRFGLDGEIVIDSPNEVTGTVAVLDAPVFDVVDLLRDYCAVEVLSERSSFTMKGRGGLPVLPNDYHWSPLSIPLR